jgi:chemotaxis protein MotB
MTSTSWAFPPQRLAAAGFGEYRPVADNTTEAGRAQNRRIELKLTER